ncbi:Uncharacterised protein [Vibrio cholerae]|nr:Uncharacterised protein [Vibrio cholerae]
MRTNLTDFAKMGIKEILLMVRKTPFRNNRAATRNDARYALGCHRHITQ